MQTARVGLLLGLALVMGCGSSRALVAVKNEQITLNKTEAEVLAVAGPPDLILALDGAETFYFRDGDQAVSVVLVDQVVAAFKDVDGWPAAAFAASQDADKPVSTGKVRLGLTESELRAAMGEPDGLTAKGGVETLHWLTGDDVDSAVDLKESVVTGFSDRPTTELSQNLPTEKRDESTTSGRLRVGMSTEEVKAALGEPAGKSGADGMVVHRYESNPFFGDTIHYSVGYRDGMVVELTEFNVTRDEEVKKKAEEARQLAAAVERQRKIASTMLTVLSNPLVQRALLGSAGQPRTVSKTTIRSTEQKSLNINGTEYNGGGAAFGQPCGIDAGCPAGYTCHIVVGSSGTCVK